MNRILELPRRDWRDVAAAHKAELTERLRAPGGAEALFDIQAAALYEIWQQEGACVFARVGAGKTKIAGLAPTLLADKGYTRPCLVVPANLKKKTDREFTEDRKHWRITHQYWLHSYTFFSLEKNAEWLWEARPDSFVFDEPDRLRKMYGNAMVKRFRQYLEWRKGEGLKTAVVFLTGTPYRDSCQDYLHWLVWSLGDGAPAPLETAKHGQVSAYLDEQENSAKRDFESHYGSVGNHEAAVTRFRERLIQTPGVIVSNDAYTGSTLTCSTHYVDPGLNEHYRVLRDLCQRPDGWELVDKSEDDAEADEINTWSVWGVARQLSLGFFYQPDPPPPADWARARSAWCRYVRDIIDNEEIALETEKQVRSMCEKQDDPPYEWTAWRDIKDTFQPNRVPVWVSDHALEHAQTWGQNAPGIIWVDHVAFGQKLSAVTGWHYYGQRGLNALGRSIEDADGRTPVIASRKANATGRNLQHAFHRNLIMTLPPCGRDVEQLIGRTHRHGQPQANVHVDVYVACAEVERALDKVAIGCEGAEGQLGLSQKWLTMHIQRNGERPSGRAFG